MLSNISKALVIICSINLIISTHKKVEKLFGDLYDKEIWAGYLKTDQEGKELFYTFTPSQKDPKNDPVMLWLNGGPGCSSLFGWLGEVGPVVTELYSNVWTVNEYAWNKEVNVLYIEQPAGVGFSKTNDPEYLWTEDKTASCLLEALKNFFYEDFPDYNTKPFYISGESYAGVYIPNLVKAIVNDQEAGRKINLKGALIGNGLTDFETDGEQSIAEFAFGHGLISLELYNAFQRHCWHLNPEFLPKDNDNGWPIHNVTHHCNEIRDEIANNLKGLDIYGILRPCIMNDDEKNKKYGTSYKQGINEMFKKVRGEQLKLLRNEFGWGDEDEEEVEILRYGCSDDYFVDDLLNDPVNREKLGAELVGKDKWAQCDHVNYPVNDSIDFYIQTIPQLKDITIWHFSGDLDGRLPTLGTMRWLQKIPYGITEEWRQWHVGKQVGGFIQKYEHNFSFLTVTGAGHMVPQDARKEAYTMLMGFLKGELE